MTVYKTKTGKVYTINNKWATKSETSNANARMAPAGNDLNDIFGGLTDKDGNTITFKEE